MSKQKSNHLLAQALETYKEDETMTTEEMVNAIEVFYKFGILDEKKEDGSKQKSPRTHRQGEKKEVKSDAVTTN